MQECRAEISPAHAMEFHVVHVIPKILLALDLHILPYFIVALQNMDIDLLKEALRLSQHPIGLFQEFLHQLPGT